MFIVSLSYTQPLTEVDKHIEGHMTWLNHYYEQGVILASGRKVPRTGGVVLMRADSPDHVQAILDEDPFRQAAVASYEITEFAPNRAAPGLERLTEI